MSIDFWKRCVELLEPTCAPNHNTIMPLHREWLFSNERQLVLLPGKVSVRRGKRYFEMPNSMTDHVQLGDILRVDGCFLECIGFPSEHRMNTTMYYGDNLIDAAVYKVV